MYGKILIFFAAVVAIQGEIELPPFLEKLMCKKSDPHFSECFRTSLKEGFAHFVKGVEELNFPPLDPLVVEYFQFNDTISDSIDFSIVVTNMVLTGIKGTTFQKVFGDPIKLRNEINMLIPRIHLNLDYNVRGKFLNVPIDMQGSLEGDFAEIAIKVRSQQRLYEKDGVEHLAFDKLNIKLQIGDGKIRMTGNTPEQNAMAEFIMRIFNENPTGVLEAVAPVAIERIQNGAMNYINSILAEIPASKLLPE